MPKAYQISQYDQPINVDGYLDLPDGFRVGIERAHLEEDTGKSTHVGGSGGRIHGSDHSLIDFNRAGVPLVEIVSRPDIRTAEQARQYVTELRAILVAIGASDAKMEEGSMRCDANVSVHQPGTPFGTRCEIKNVNSVRSLGRAIEYEARRQVALIVAGETVRQETRHWDENDGRTHTLRTKEDADDYRYFLEPDLVPLAPSADWIAGGPRGDADAAGRASGAPERCHRRCPPTAKPIMVVDRARPGRLRAGGRAPRRRHRPRRLVHVKEAFADQGPEPAVPAAGPGVADHDGGPAASSPPPRPRPCWPRSSPTAAATPPPSRPPRASRRWTSSALEAHRRSGHRRQRRGVGEVLRRRGQGDGRARRRGR